MVDLKEISAALQKGRAKVVKEMVQQAIDDGMSAKKILDEGLLEGMNIIGAKFKVNEVYSSRKVRYGSTCIASSGWCEVHHFSTSQVIKC